MTAPPLDLPPQPAGFQRHAGPRAGMAAVGTTRSGGLPLRSVLTNLFYYRWSLVLLVTVPLIVGVVIALQTQTRYMAVARLLVLPGSEHVVKPDLGQAFGDFILSGSTVVRAEQEILGSIDVIESVIEKVGFARLYPDLLRESEGALDYGTMMGRAVTRFRRDLVVGQGEEDSTVILIGFRANDRALSAEVTNLVVAEYQVLRQRIFRNLRSPVLIEQRDRAAAQVTALQAEIEAFRAARGIYDFKTQSDYAQMQVSRLQAALDQVRERLADRIGARDKLIEQRLTLPVAEDVYRDTSRTTEFAGANDMLLGLRMRRAEILDRFTGPSPDLAMVDQQIADVEAFLRGTPARDDSASRRNRAPILDTLDRNIAQTNAEIEGLQARQAVLQGAVEAARTDIARLAELDVPLRSLERQLVQADEDYVLIARKLEEALVAEDAALRRDTAVRVLAAAEPPVRGEGLRRVIVAVALLLGLVMAVMSLAVRLILRQVFLEPAEAERRLALPILLTLTERDPGGRSSGRLLVRLAPLLVLGGLVLGLVWLVQNPTRVPLLAPTATLLGQSYAVVSAEAVRLWRLAEDEAQRRWQEWQDPPLSLPGRDVPGRDVPGRDTPGRDTAVPAGAQTTAPHAEPVPAPAPDSLSSSTPPTSQTVVPPESVPQESPLQESVPRESVPQESVPQTGPVPPSVDPSDTQSVTPSATPAPAPSAAPSTTPAAAAPIQRQPSFIVRAGSFRNEEGAQRLIADLRKRGYTVAVTRTEPAVEGSDRWTIVRVTGVAGRANLDRLLAYLRETWKLSPLVAEGDGR